MWVQSLGWEDPLEEGTTALSILAWRLPWTEEPGKLQSVALQSCTQLKRLGMHSQLLFQENRGMNPHFV